MRMFFESVAELFSLLLILTVILVGMVITGCERIEQVVGPVSVNDAAEMSAYVESSTYAVHSDGQGVVYVRHKTRDESVVIGGPLSSPIFGVGGLPKNFFDEFGRLKPWLLEEDIEGEESFGSTLAIYPGNLPVSMVGADGMLLAVGAPDVDEGRGAVYVFRVGSYGLWFEDKITPINERTRGFGSEIEFKVSDEGVEYIAIQSRNRAEGMSLHVALFLSIG